MKKNKKAIIVALAAAAVVIGSLVAAFAYLKRKADIIGEKLDFDGDLFYDDLDDPDFDDNCEMISQDVDAITEPIVAEVLDESIEDETRE